MSVNHAEASLDAWCVQQTDKMLHVRTAAADTLTRCSWPLESISTCIDQMIDDSTRWESRHGALLACGSISVTLQQRQDQGENTSNWLSAALGWCTRLLSDPEYRVRCKVGEVLAGTLSQCEDVGRHAEVLQMVLNDVIVHSKRTPPNTEDSTALPTAAVLGDTDGWDTLESSMHVLTCCLSTAAPALLDSALCATICECADHQNRFIRPTPSPHRRCSSSLRPNAFPTPDCNPNFDSSPDPGPNPTLTPTLIPTLVRTLASTLAKKH